jgi:hypothetical protein
LRTADFTVVTILNALALLLPHFSPALLNNIVTRFARQRDKNNVDSSDLTREFIGTIV